MRDLLVLECTSCESEGVCPRVELGEDADVFKSDGGPGAFLLFMGAHRNYPGHWDPQKHRLIAKLGERKLYPSEVAAVFRHIPLLVERLSAPVGMASTMPSF